MKICGLAKLTLLDYPGHTAATVFTGGCNFRCPFCHNAPLVTAPVSMQTIEEEDFFSFLNKRKGILDGVCITGGEPLLMPDISEFIRKIRAEGFKIKLDTNGSFPKKLAALLDEGLLDYVAMDIKNTPPKYSLTAGAEVDLVAISESIGTLLSGRVPYEFRTTIVDPLHTVEDIETIARRIEGAAGYFLQNFVDSGNLIGEGLRAHTPESMIRMRDCARRWVPNAEIRGL